MPLLPGRSARRRAAAWLAAALFALVAGAAAAPARQTPAADPACGVTAPDRVVAVGDVHGAFDRFVAILREARLIDGRRRWVGGRATLVQTGDVLDRGADSRRVIDLLRQLEREAARAGGAVHALLGNHEVMRMLGDLRYVSEAEYAAFRTPDAEALRERFYEIVSDERRAAARAAGQEFDERGFRKLFLEQVPLGLVEMKLAFAPDGEYGRWLRERATLAVINGVAFLHGGLTPAVAAKGCAAINATVRAELRTLTLTDPAVATSLASGPEGPLWYRGLADGDPTVTPATVGTVLAALGVRAIVVGHTVPEARRIEPRFGGRVYPIDTGMLGGTHYPDGVASAIEFAGATVTAIYEGRREPLAGAAIRDR